jgi:hypothetical protein
MRGRPAREDLTEQIDLGLEGRTRLFRDAMRGADRPVRFPIAAAKGFGNCLQADRSPDRHYRTAPLNGLWSHQKGGFYHDGRFPTLRNVVDHHNSVKALGLTGGEVADVVEYLESL